MILINLDKDSTEREAARALVPPPLPPHFSEKTKKSSKDLMATAMKMWKKLIVILSNTFLSTLEKLNNNSQGHDIPCPQISFTSPLAPPFKSLLCSPCWTILIHMYT